MFFKNNRGFGLLDLMAGLVITSVIAAGTATFMSRQQKLQKDLQLAENMRSVARKVEMAIGKPEVILASSQYSSNAGNLELKKCITYVTKSSAANGPKEPCVATDPSRQISFELILPFSRANNSISFSQIYKNKLAGTDDSPARYSIQDANRCDAHGLNRPTGDCQLEVRAYFWATCPAQEAFREQYSNSGNKNLTGISCPTAESINIRYQVVHKNAEASSDTTAPKKVVTTHQLPSIPSDHLFYKSVGIMSSFGAIVTSVSKIPNDSSLMLDACGPNYTLVQVVSGKAECACMYPFREQVADLITTCIPRDKKCKSNERYRGTDDQGNIICQPVTCFPNIPTSVGCGTGGWIESIRPTMVPNSYQPDRQDSCISEVCHVDKDGGACESVVACAVNMTCCYETAPQGL